MGLTDFLFAAGLIVAAVAIVLLVVGGLLSVIVVANRADPDPSGRRPVVVYGFGIAFVTLFLALFASYGVVASLCRLIGGHAESTSFPPTTGALDPGVLVQSTVQHPLGDAVARGSVLGGLIALVAAVAFLLHLRLALRGASDAAPEAPAGRVRSSYVAAVCFVCVLIIVVTTVAVAYDVFRLAGPGVFSPGESGGRDPATRSLLSALYLAVATLAVLRWHLRNAPPTFRSVVWPRTTPDEPADVVVVEEPPMLAPELLVSEPPARAPRKRTPRKTTTGDGES